MNILTKGINNKEEVSFSQNVGNNGFLRSTVGYNSGKLKNGWGYSLAGSYKRGDGWVDQTWTEGFFYFMKVQKSLKTTACLLLPLAHLKATVKDLTKKLFHFMTWTMLQV